MNNDSLRRAAILIATLDTASADALLSEMTPNQAALIRNAVMELGDINIIEQQDIVEQFVGKPPHTADTDNTSDPGVEIDPELASKFATSAEPTVDAHETAESPRHTDVPPFAFLESVEPQQIARALVGEHPQTTAIVAAHLTPARAAEVISHLPPQLRTETLMRIARLHLPHPDILRDLEHEMRARLANRQQPDQVGTDGLARVEAILQSTAVADRLALVADLSRQDQALVGQLQTATSSQPPAITTHRFKAPAGGMGRGDSQAIPESYASDTRVARPHPALEFADLEQLDDATLALVLQRGTPNTTLLALAGASHPFVRRILSQLSPREATQLERKIQRIGPLRLDDVQRAQQQIVAIAQQLMEEGILTLPGKPRLSVAA